MVKGPVGVAPLVNMMMMMMRRMNIRRVIINQDVTNLLGTNF